ncbi:hypothetical protein ACFQUU_20950 [Herbaspirillum sp. GCM10030257]|uniref:hypothetical protein n=1 Tax=Herbaspirillum sp. GCM10030257 TaxID=3273393 RepID=UPI0036211FE9
MTNRDAGVGMQVLGGHGYIHESGLEPTMHQACISITYERTNDVQALNLLDRKILLDQDVKLRQRSKRIKGFIDVHKKKATRR